MRRLIVLLAVLALVLAACGGGDSGGDVATDASPPSAGDAAGGEEIFLSTCAACHGADAKGLEGLGKDLHNNVFVAGLSDDELVEFLKVGRGTDDPDNDTGVAMPPKGGNPSLTDSDLEDVVAFLRTLE